MKRLPIGRNPDLDMNLSVMLILDRDRAAKLLQTNDNAMDGLLGICHCVFVSPAPGMATGKGRNGDTITALIKLLQFHGVNVASVHAQ